MKAKKEKDPQAEAVRFYRCCIIFIVCVCLFWAWEAWVIYQRNPHNKKADDAISRVVYEAMGAKELYYLGKTEYEDGGVRYDYHMEGETAELVPKVADVVNRELENAATDSRIKINFIHDYGPYERSKAVLSNYRQQDNIFIDYDTLQYLNIDADFDNTYDMYKDVPDIHYLSTRGMAVEELGISQWAERGMGQWKAYWPELETVEVYAPVNHSSP